MSGVFFFNALELREVVGVGESFKHLVITI